MKKIMRLLPFLTFYYFSLIALSTNAGVTPYPAVDGLKTGSLYKVKVNNIEIWTEKYVSNLDFEKLPDWFSDSLVRKPQEQHISSFAGTGKMNVTINIDGIPKNVKIKPVSRNIKPVINGNQISFTWEGPGQIVIETDDLPPLYLYANPDETEIPKETAVRVKYFGPGEHHAGYIEMKDNETVYIAAGAVVYGGIRANGVSNIRVIGRGILDGNYEFQQMVLIENSSNIRFEGVTIRNGRGWTNTLVNCRNIEYSNVKVLGFGPSSDGINPAGSQQVRIKDCFMRCTDDCVAIKAPDYQNPVQDVLVTNCIMIGFAYADGVTIGYETNAAFIKNVTVRDCDILLARGGSRVEGHSGFSIICDGPAEISNILFENIRVEKSEIKLFELNITDGTLYGDDKPGHITNVTLKNVEWFHEGPIIIRGFGPSNRVQNVTFENCTVAGKPLKTLEKKIFSINEFTDNINVK
jgi:polygalacturonase